MNFKTTIVSMALSTLACAAILTPASADMSTNPSVQNRAAATKGSPAGGDSSMDKEGHEGHMAKHGAKGMHSMKGTVEDLDTQTGSLTLKTAEGELKLHFPPKSLAQVKKGDELQVHLSFSPVK